MKPPTIQVQALYRCPFCGRQVTRAQQLQNVRITGFTPVYRCRCGKVIGEPQK